MAWIVEIAQNEHTLKTTHTPDMKKNVMSKDVQIINPLCLGVCMDLQKRTLKRLFKLSECA